MKDIKVRFGKRVKQLRVMRDMTQQQLAEAADMSISFLGFIERGQKSPTIETVERLANALDVTLSELMALDTEIPFAEDQKAIQLRRLLSEYADRIQQICKK